LELLQLAEAGTISRKTENTGFTCARCGMVVAALANGSYRNHCPRCLYSRHVDVRPGDRAAGCRGLMEPIGLDHHSKKGDVVVHRCLNCGSLERNRAAPDDVDALVRFAAGRVYTGHAGR
jgi:DNA-directed RNA polymerase subunit RPC12/RpoP